jgi:VWA N-terminal.
MTHVMYVTAEPILDVIKWSEALDDIFIQNYFSDPALSFQYFGSSLGVMRSYPGEKYYLFYRVMDLVNVG